MFFTGRRGDAATKGGILTVLILLLVTITFYAFFNTTATVPEGPVIVHEPVMCTTKIECPFTHAGEPKCQHVYFDLGSNMGVQVRKIFEPRKFERIPPNPDDGTKVRAPALAHFDSVFGSDRDSVCVVGVEPNPHYKKSLDDTERVYNARGWRTIFLRLAVSNVDGDNITFFSDPEHMGSSLYKWHEGMPFLTVATVDMALFIDNFLKHHNPTSVAMKVDIEGAEYAFLPRMLQLGAFCRVSVAFIEFHPHFLKDDDPEKANKLEFQASFQEKVKSKTLVPLSPSCPTGSQLKVVEDDETCWNCAWDGGPQSVDTVTYYLREFRALFF